MVSLRFYGGVGEIGGNKILLEDKDTRVFLDFGQSFSFGQDYYTGYLAPRNSCYLKDCFEFGLLPKIGGLYSEKELSCTNLKYTSPEIDAILLSHAHFDHCAHLELADSKIPVYCGQTTKIFLEAMEETGGQKFGEHEFRLFRTGDKFKVNSLEVEPIHVDHSIPGAYGYLLHTSEGCVVYTGDLRMHGPMGEMTHEFILKASKEKPIALITEGTRVSPEETRKPHTEAYVKEKSAELVSAQKNMSITTFYGRDIDRINTFYSVAKESGRKFAISTKTAYLLDKLSKDGRLKVPSPLKDGTIGVYLRRKKSGNYEEKDYFLWERPYLSNPVYSEEIKKSQADYLLSLNLFEFGELIDLQPKEGSLFIHSMSEPFSEEDVAEEVKQNWVSHFKLKFQQLHASGHCKGEEVGAIVKEINPKSVFPVHTEHPELFSGYSKRAVIPKIGAEYRL